MSEKKLTIKLLNGVFGVCRLNNKDKYPEWAVNQHFYSVTKTADELSVVCLQEDIPDGVQCERDWRLLKVMRVLDFSLIGIIYSISQVLAENKISIFVISTYDTDYILIRDKDIEKALKALSEKYEIIKDN